MSIPATTRKVASGVPLSGLNISRRIFFEVQDRSQSVLISRDAIVHFCFNERHVFHLLTRILLVAGLRSK